MIKKISFILFLLMSISLNSQETNFDKYQYIVVSDRFEFLNESDQYQTSSLTKFLLKKKGFKVFLSNEKLPKDLNSNRCLGLFADVKEESSMFSIKNIIEIKDCYGKVLYASKTGSSKIKTYKKGYQEAIRNAFETMEDFEYSYNASFVDDDTQKQETIVKNNSDKVIDTVITPKTIVISDVKNEVINQKNDVTTLYAQAIENGFQLVNTKPEVVFILLKTNVKDVFVIKDKNGNFYKKGTNWIAEYYENNKLVKKEFQVRF